MSVQIKRIIRGVIETLLLSAAAYMLIVYAKDYKEELIREKQAAESIQSEERIFDLWYSYTGYEGYLKEAVKRYEEQTGIKIRLTYYTTIDYLDKISSAGANGNAPDLFLMSEENLQNAVLLGIAEQNYDTELITEENYAKKALESIRFMDKQYGYPMGFETTVFVANKAYVDSMPKSFDEVKSFADNFNNGEDAEEHDYSNVTAILKWDISDVTYNYGFIGAYLDVGGEDRDNPLVIDVNNEKAVSAGQYYYSLAQYFYTDAESARYKNLINDFMQGKVIYTIASADIIERLGEGDIQAELMPLPSLTDKLKTKQISVTDIIMVNPFGDMKEEARDFARFLSFDMADEMYELCGVIATKKDDCENPYIKEFVDAYELSTGLPKLMTTGDYWIKIQNVMENIWNGSDVKEQLDNLGTELNERIN